MANILYRHIDPAFLHAYTKTQPTSRYKLSKIQFFSRTENFPVEHKPLLGHNMISSGLRKMLTLINFNIFGVWVLVCPATVLWTM